VPVKAGPRMPLLRRLSLLAGIVVLVLATIAHASAWAQLGPFGGLRPPAATGIFGWVLAQQAFFYRALAGLIRAAKTNGSAYWALMGISFVYGIFHAAGPGHGKAVISSYLLANEETWRRGVTLSFASAVLQSLAAIAIVAIAAVLIGATAKMMGDTVRDIEIVSYTLIIIVGARLVWVKGRSFLATLRAVRAASEAAEAAEAGSCPHHTHAHGCVHVHDGPHAVSRPPPLTPPQPKSDVSDFGHFDIGRTREHPGSAGEGNGHEHAHQHAHDHDEEESVLPWGHAHGPEPEELAGPGGWRRGLSAIVAVGLRPCSGAIIVLVFALAQGLFWAGIASTFVMGLGTAITVTAIATLAVGAKSLAKRFATARAGYGALVLRGVEAGAAGLVILVGVLLLTGYMASERMGLF
jgi:nickel/cobalt transporter (NicO) family protein